MKLNSTGILLSLFLLVVTWTSAMAAKHEEDQVTKGMTIDEIIERANQKCQGGGGRHCEEAPYIVQGDIAMTKEQYEEYMADWKKQEAELIAKGEIKPPK